MGRSKFNVDQNAATRSCDGITFDSALEMRYYQEIVRPKQESGELLHYELQKSYVLQPGFTRQDGKKIRPVTYVADFYLEFADGSTQVIDTKGFPDSVCQLKRKLFWFIYPDVEYHWVAYSKKWGGWLEYETLRKLRKEEKRKKKKEELKNGKAAGKEDLSE